MLLLKHSTDLDASGNENKRARFKCVKDRVKDQLKKMSNATSYAIKRLYISKHLVKCPVCGCSNNEMRFKILKNCTNILYLVKKSYIHLLEHAKIMQAKRIVLFVILV